ncbi:hypothetical protein QBC39DRAFT_48075 [Podospora conica]|nr:hypothetical protein QBC39DRAFT_48075 [Schizothecium conicum]
MCPHTCMISIYCVSGRVFSGRLLSQQPRSCNIFLLCPHNNNGSIMVLMGSLSGYKQDKMPSVEPSFLLISSPQTHLLSRTPVFRLLNSQTSYNRYYYVPVGNALMVQGMDDFPNSLVTPADINNGRNQRADGTNDDGSWDVVSQGPLGSDWDLVSQGEPRVASDVVSHGEFRVDCDGLGSDYELIFDAGEPVRPRLTELFLLRLSLMTLGMPRRLHIPHLFLQPLPRFAVIFMHTGVIVIRVGAVVIRSGLRTVWHHAPRIMALASAMGNTTIRVGQHTVEVGMLGYEMLGFFLQQLKDFQP